MFNALGFTSPPPTPWLRLLLSRRRWTGEVPPLVATLSDVIVAVPPAYRTLCGFSGHGCPLPWPQVWAAPLHAQLLAHADFPLPAMGLVHVWQRCEALSPLPEGAKVTLRARFDGHRPARRGVEVDLVTTVLRGDEAVWEGRTRFLSRAAPGDGVDRPVDEVEVGAAGVEETWELGADLGRRYAAVAGDRNPIHQYAWSARLFGFERAIIHGMWTVGRVVAASPDAPRVVETTFRRPIFLPGTARAVIDADGAFAVTADRGDRPSVVGRLR